MIKFDVRATFERNVPNSYFYENLNTWVFLDDKGGLHTLNLTTRQTTYTNIQDSVANYQQKNSKMQIQ